jgi:hypothetical protein
VGKHCQQRILRWRRCLREPCLPARALIDRVLLLGPSPEREGQKQDRCECVEGPIQGLCQVYRCRNIINNLQTACLQTEQGEGRSSQVWLIVLICADFRQSEPDAGKWTTLIRRFNPASGEFNAGTIHERSSARIPERYRLDHLNHRLTPPFSVKEARNAGYSYGVSATVVVYPGMI